MRLTSGGCHGHPPRVIDDVVVVPSACGVAPCTVAPIHRERQTCRPSVSTWSESLKTSSCVKPELYWPGSRRFIRRSIADGSSW